MQKPNNPIVKIDPFIFGTNGVVLGKNIIVGSYDNQVELPVPEHMSPLIPKSI